VESSDSEEEVEDVLLEQEEEESQGVLLKRPRHQISSKGVFPEPNLGMALAAHLTIA
jgi:hypothetical protein